MLIELDENQRQLKRLTKKLDHHKNKESKFLYLLFTLQNRGFPVNEIYEQEVKDIPTARFAEMQNEQMMEKSSLMISFYSDDSYELIEPKVEPKNDKRPKGVPALDLLSIPDYQTSSDEDEEGVANEQEQLFKLNAEAHVPQMDTQAYQQSMDYIENFYSKCAAAPDGIDSEQLEVEVEDEHFVGVKDSGSSIMIVDRTNEDLDEEELVYSGVERRRRRKGSGSDAALNSA